MKSLTNTNRFTLGIHTTSGFQFIEAENILAINSSTLAGVAIGTTTSGTATQFTLGGSQTASSAIARGGLINTTLVAAANNDVLVGLDINPTFTNGAFTGVTNYILRGFGANGANVILGGGQNNSGTSTINIYGTNRLDRSGFISAVATGSFSNNSIVFGLNFFDGTTLFTDNYITIGSRTTNINFATLSNNPYIYPTTTNSNASLQFGNSTNNPRGAAIYAIASGVSSGTSRLDFAITNAANPQVATTDVAMSLFNSKNFAINTTTDAGFRLDVNGTARVQGELTVNGVRIGLGGGAISSNTRVGGNALNNNTSGANNSAFGSNALLNNTSGTNNSSFGQNALVNNTSGSANNSFGAVSLERITSGSRNIAIGFGAARFIADGTSDASTIDNSIIIGYNSRVLANSQTNQIVIGYDVTGLGSNTTVLGNTSTTLTALYGNIRLASGMATAPASATATGTTGDVRIAADYIYVCSATNTWVRAALTTW
jgi:hypothetical protein